MLAVGTSKEAAEELIQQARCSGSAVVACINSYSSVTLSGDEEAINELQRLAEQRGIFNRKLRVDVAYHSHHMGLVSAPYQALMGDIHPQTSSIQFYSSLFGREAQSSELNSSYWVENLLSPVNFVGGLHSLLQDAKSSPQRHINTLIEIGPHSALEGPIREISERYASGKNVRYLASLRRKADAVESVQQLAAALFMRGLNLNFKHINSYGDQSRQPSLLINLPKYPWDHSVKYWHDSRWADSQCHKPFPRNDILGSFTIDSNPTERKWRNVIRVDDHPWIRQHQVQGKNVYPFVGYVAMAIEAFSQSAALRNLTMENYCLREVSVGKALVIPDTSSVEVLTTLRPFADGTRVSSEAWYDFRVSATLDGREWMEYCRGLISGDKEEDLNPVDGVRQLQEKEADARRRLSMVTAPGMSLVDVDEMYDNVSDSGVQYGHIFRGMSNIISSKHHAVADFDVPNTSSVMPDGYESGCILHPVTLDHCIQLMWPLVGYRSPGQKQVYLPTFVGSLYVNCKTPFRAGDHLKLYGTRLGSLHPRRPANLHFVATKPENPSDVLIRVDDVKVSPLVDHNAWPDRPMKNQCYKIQDTPCLEFLDSRFTGLLKRASPDLTELDRLCILEQASFYFLDSARDKLSATECNSVQGHHHHFLDWIRKIRHKARNGGLPLQNSDWLGCNEEQRAKVIEKARSFGAPGELICRLGSLIPQILRREVEPLSVMVENGLLDRYYQELDSFRRSYAAAISFVDKMADQKPQMNILEVGAGTGGATLPIIRCLGGGDTQKAPRFGHYTFTDVSSGFLREAKEKLRVWGDLLDYRTLDIYEDPVHQDYNEHSYDLIIACNVLHVTPKLERTLANVHKLLKPGGKLLLIEETGNQLRQFIYALLPGWWQSEDGRIDGPVLDKSSWDELLKETGFSGLDLALDDYPGAPQQCGSLIVTTSQIIPDLKGRQVTIVCPEDSSSFPIEDLARRVEALTGCAPDIGPLSGVDCEGKLCIFLAEVDGPILSQLDEAKFKSIQSLLQEASGLLWVVREDYGSDRRGPESHLITGLARSIRSETTFPLVTLHLQATHSGYDQNAVEHIFNVFGRSFDARSNILQIDREYSVKDGMIYVPRMVNDMQLNDFVHKAAGRSGPALQPLRQQDRALKLVAGEPGILDTLHFTDDKRGPSELPEEHIEIQVEYVGLNFKDVMTAMGQMSNDVLGNECSGIVTRVGSDVAGFAEGDRVCAVCEGAFATRIACPETSVWRVPDNIDLKVAATIPVIFCTAYYSLFDIGRLVEGETILIHAAAGGVGQAAIILANIIGAKVFATVSSPEKKKFLMDNYSVDERRIFYSRDSSFAEGVLRATNGEGVDLVLNSLAGDMLRASWNCVAPFGRFVELGKKDILRNSCLEMSCFDRNISFSSVDLTAISEKRPKVMRRLLSHIFELFRNGSARPVAPINTYSASDIESAFRSLQGGRGLGKSVIEFKANALVKVSIFSRFESSCLSLQWS
jgi:NADPH:quinone reductase-like Zn-dependent oxidoreductase/SAM-dependent methyltransferase